MRALQIQFIFLAGLLTGCAGYSAVKPVEALDERSGITLGVLNEPIELLPKAQHEVLVLRKRPTFAYLGPVEWNRSGDFSYGLWIHLAAGSDRQFGNIHDAGAVTLLLDDGQLVLMPMEPPTLAHEPYHEAVPWGQTAYFQLNAAMLRRMAASRTLELDIRAAGGDTVGFHPTVDTGAVLTDYVKSRQIAGD